MEQQIKNADIRPYTRQFFKGNGWCFALAMVETILMTVGSLSVSWLIQQILDLVAGEPVAFNLEQLVLFSIAVVVGIAIASAVSYVSKPRFIARAIAQYKDYVFSQLSKKSISAFTGENTSLYISALSNDAATIESKYLEHIFGIIGQSLLFVSALTMMFCYSPLLTVISIALSVLPIIVSILFGNRMANAEKKVSDLNETYMSTLRDALSGFSVVKSFRAEVQMCRLFAQRVKEVSNAKEIRLKLHIIIQTLSEIAGIIVQFGVFLVGAYLALSGKGVTVGTVLVFVQLLNFVLGPIGSIPTFLAEYQAAKALIQKLANALNENIREEGTEDLHTLTGGIQMQDVSFGYEPEKPVLQHISFTFEAGKRYAVVGASGSGKSTLLNLLMASHASFTGSICYDGTPLRNIRSESLYELISVVQQNVFVFNASIRDNITMFSPFPSEEVERAIELSGLSGLIAQRGEAYLCGENGSGLSGGEKQRISIARSLLKKSQVLLVDEATAALDAQTALQVSQAILQLQGLTRIVVTHALEENLLKQYDCVLAMKNGRIVESGSFDELIEKKGYFYSLFTVSQ
ncbi:MAG: ABC transporter ATP-binding protein [Oscillospiraceae bacterium]|nr:ABC transporter ATP-binding protein [Oscillospiraceae bacterium]